MTLSVQPAECKVGDEVSIHGDGFKGTHLHVHVTYQHRAESYKAEVAGDEHPKFKPGVIDLTVRAEEAGVAQVSVYSSDGRTLLAEGHFMTEE